jgi:hypothetical protein
MSPLFILCYGCKVRERSRITRGYFSLRLDDCQKMEGRANEAGLPE